MTVPWQDRPRLLLGSRLAVAVLVALGWWLGRPSSAGPIDDAIPFATAPAAAVPDGGGPGPGGGADREAAPGGAAATPGPGAGVAPGPEAPPPAELVVHVAGAVLRPGIVHLPAGARVVDAIDAAGGTAADADLDQLNLAAPVGDGVQVRVPRDGETLAAPITPASPAPGDGGQGAGPATAMVDLNRATAGELEQLPGIGPSLAAAIVTWRTDHGPFGRVDDLLDVPGIGPAKLSALADHVTV